MKKLASGIALGLFSLLVPFTASAQSSSGGFSGATIGAYLSSIITFINAYLIPFIFAIAFIVFIWGIFQYFIAGGANEEQRDKGKQLAMWGIIAFAVMLSLWGIVNLLVATFGLGDQNARELPKFTPGAQNSGGTYGPTP